MLTFIKLYRMYDKWTKFETDQIGKYNIQNDRLLSSVRYISVTVQLIVSINRSFK